MKFSDVFAQRMLGLSAVIFSLAILVAAISLVQPAQATEPEPFTPNKPMPWDSGLRGSVGLGIEGDKGYFIVFTNEGNQFYEVNLSKARDWYLD